jgi:hypothetical protein
MKDEVKATLVDSFAPAQSPLPSRLCRLPRASRHPVFSPARPLANAFGVAKVRLVRSGDARESFWLGLPHSHLGVSATKNSCFRLMNASHPEARPIKDSY